MTLREGSFLERSKLPLRNWLCLLYWWAQQYAVTMASEEAETTNRTAIDIYQWLREMYVWRLLTIDDCHLGGPESVVEIDESLFKDKPKVNF